MIANAAPPNATQAPPNRPRASRLDTPPESRRCEYQPAAITAIVLAPVGSAPNRPMEPWVKPSPLIRNAPCHESACERPQYAPKLAHQHATIVGFNNSRR